MDTKKKAVIIVLIALTGIFSYTTTNPEQAFINNFIGGVGSISLLTVIFFVAGMLKETKWVETVKSYIIVFGLIVVWSLVLGLLLRL